VSFDVDSLANASVGFEETDVVAQIDAVRLVSTPDGNQGTAFFVDSTHLLTAAHVVGLASHVSLRGDRDSGDLVDAQVVFVDDAQDIAVLLVENPPMSSLEFAGAVPSIGAPVYAIGGPIDGLVVSRGRMEVSSSPGLLAASTPVDPGSSGGPLLNSSGAVVGMVVQEGVVDGTAYVVPYSVLEVALSTSSTATPRPVTLDASLGSSWLFLSFAALVILMTAAAILVVAVLARRKRARPPRIVITLGPEER